MPCGAAGQLLALKQHNIGPPFLGKVIRDRASDDAAADDDHTGLGGKINHVDDSDVSGLAQIATMERQRKRQKRQLDCKNHRYSAAPFFDVSGQMV